MYFKRLELFGFKSFAEKTKLKFEPGVTAVVGPNGCGKSNIADAIKWVLGEQSAKELRGSRMEDVIFNGTSNKDPINMSEVSLVLCNKDKVLPIDYEEVIITRRLFRSGESEYLLNKMPVRLKDINDLLAGTGIGQSSYSMIEQGRIGLILSSKPEERRYILEEASGITKYKNKKKEALRKLEHTETNLVRINDIINEVHRQIQSIERQARKAEKYKRDFEVLKDMDLKFSSFQYKNIMNELKTMSIENEDLKKREESLSQYHFLLNEEVLEARGVIDRINEDSQKAQKEISETDSAIDKNLHTVKINRERIAEFKALSENLEQEITLLEDKLKNKGKDLEVLEKELASSAAAKNEKENALRQYEETLNAIIKEIEECYARVKENKIVILDIVSTQTKSKNELIKLGAEVQSRKIRISRLKTEKDNVLKEKEDLCAKLTEVNLKLEAARDMVNSRARALAGLKEKLNTTENLIQQVRQNVSDLRGTQEALKSKRELLNELIEKNEGFGKGVQSIMEMSESNEYSANPVLLADIIRVENGFEQAAESALGELSRALVVKNREEGIQLIGFLQRKGVGRANFLISGDVPVLEDHTDVSLPNLCQPITDFIKCGDEHRGLICYIFRNTYIVDSPESADTLFGRFGNYRFVTKKGYLRQGARIFGGAVIEADTSILGRKERIKDIERDLVLINSRLAEEAVKENTEKETLQKYKDEIGEAEKALREAEVLLANIDAECQSFTGNVKRLGEELNVLDIEIAEDAQTLDAFIKRGEDINHSLNTAEEENNRVQNLIVTYENTIKERSALKESTLLRIADIKGELSAISVSYDNAVANLNLRKEECSEITRDAEARENQARNALEKMELLSNNILQLDIDHEVLMESKKLLEARSADLAAKKTGEIEEFNRKTLALREEGSMIESIRNNMRDLDIKLAEVRFRKTSLVERVSQAYKADLSGLNIEIDESTNWEEIKERIEELKERLDKMGPVNLVAIEEHKELEERYAFLTRQKDDLVNAKESLHKAIVKINATTRKLFIETFQKVQEEFRNYFRMLFGGGQAEMFLLDERDILESGIEIVVRPPGKKLQNILLLSGGEKALTAIALLFAVFKVNPSPFCVLDEIDAPLDETNIDRFTRVLQEFLKMSQFIIITHNKKTIQMADVLYGITMAEKGVSKIVSVKFADNDSQEEEESREEILV